MSDIEQDFLVHQGRNIKLARQFRGVKNEDLAKRLNISTATLSRLENQQKVDDDMLKNIALALDVQLNSLKTFSLDKEFSTLNNVAFNDTVSVTDGGDNVGVKEVQQETNNFYPLEQVIELTTKLFDMQKEHYEKEMQLLGEKHGLDKENALLKLRLEIAEGQK